MSDHFELLDTPPLRDQRTMVDVTHPQQAHRTVEDVEAAWQRWADREGLTVRRRQGDYSTDLRRSRKAIVVHISGGKWIGDCPECRGGVAGWPCHPHGACLDCGTIFKLLYPTPAECLELADLLRVRPERERNYFPHLGEDIEMVRRENRVNKYGEQAPSGVVDLTTVRDVLGEDALTKLLGAKA